MIGGSEDDAPPGMVERVRANLGRKWQQIVDKSTVYMKSRWAGLLVVLAIYSLRVYLAAGWYIVTYGLGIYLLNLFIAFLSPKVDAETDDPILPTKTAGDEFKPMERKVGEFEFWRKAMVAVIIAFTMTFFNLFNIPVFWPILLIYFITLFALTMRRQIQHMIKYRYLPCSRGKKRYVDVAGGTPGPTRKNAD